jgi:hypothetical protein
MYNVRLSAVSTETILVPARATNDGLPIELSVLSVRAALVAVSDIEALVKFVPDDDDWEDQTWSILPSGRYEIEVLLGPNSGGLVPAGPSGSATTAVRYQVWTEVRSGDEIVRRHAFNLSVTR